MGAGDPSNVRLLQSPKGRCYGNLFGGQIDAIVSPHIRSSHGLLNGDDPALHPVKILRAFFKYSPSVYETRMCTSDVDQYTRVSFTAFARGLQY